MTVLYEPLSNTVFTALGMGYLACNRRIRGEEARGLFQIDITMDMELFSLHSADGTQIILTVTTYESVVSSARGNNLDPVMVH